MNAEKNRLLDKELNWKKWGPYIADRQWGTVREDYSINGDAWNYLPFDHAKSRVYRWGEDGIGGISDINQLICFAPAFWNSKDEIVKERFFGLNNYQGNHGEDLKEYYYYLDNTPTHSYMKMLYKYPHSKFPYDRLILENKERGLNEPEYELIDSGIFDKDEYFDIFIEYSKASPEDILIKISAFNRGRKKASLNIIPQLWFRNTWSWKENSYKPVIKINENSVLAEHEKEGDYYLYYEGNPELLFCENETNIELLYGIRSGVSFYKDGINECIVNKNFEAVNQNLTGTKCALNYHLELEGSSSAIVRLRLSSMEIKSPFTLFDNIFDERKTEADKFYEELQKGILNEDEKNIQRQALAGVLWSKQFYSYDIREWLIGDPAQPSPPPQRKKGRNSDWFNLTNNDIILMPDKWEYPWYATWDLAFHCIPAALVDPQFAKEQLLLFTKEWYMHPSGQLPAYEWNLSDVNPPVHAWAAWRVFKMDEKANNKSDYDFLERIFLKLLLNFTWWVNKKDYEGRNIFQGGFLGMDNIGIFDRSNGLDEKEHLDQADGTSWMGMYSLNLMRIALELSKIKPHYQDLAAKFFEHFLYIAKAMTHIGDEGIGLWDEEDQFYYDVLHSKKYDRSTKIKIRSMVGLIPLFAVEVLDHELLECSPEFTDRLKWLFENRPDLSSLVSRWFEHGKGERTLLSLLRGSRMKKLIKRMLDETEYLSDYGIRSLSRVYKENPYEFHNGWSKSSISYAPAESNTEIFGGNSNWRGPIWFPVNFLIIESLQRFHHYYGDDFKIEYPVNSGKYITILNAAEELTKRLKKIFLKNAEGNRAVFGTNKKFQTDPHFKDYLLFYEYFNGDTGEGLGASHQTGWTALIAKLIQPRKE